MAEPDNEYRHHAPDYDARGADFEHPRPAQPQYELEPHEVAQLANPPAPPEQEPPR